MGKRRTFVGLANAEKPIKQKVIIIKKSRFSIPKNKVSNVQYFYEK